jgi:hypothetical protein
MRGVKFQENPSNVRWDTDGKTLSFPNTCKAPLIMPIRDQTYIAVSVCVVSARIEDSGKALKWTPRYSQKSTLLLMSNAPNY